MYVLPENLNNIPLTLVDKIAHSDEIYSFVFKPLKPVTWGEGMHSKIYINIFGRTYNKTFSHASRTKEGEIRFTMRAKKIASAYKSEMKKLNIGDKIYISKPEGDFVLKRDGRSILMLSNGVGLATYRPHILNFAENGEGIPQLIQLNVDRSFKLFDDEFSIIERENPNFTSMYTSGRKAFYPALDNILQRFKDAGSAPYIYLVGSTEFVESLYTYLTERGVDSALIVTDGDIDEGLRCSCGSSVVCDCGGHESPDHGYDLDDVLA